MASSREIHSSSPPSEVAFSYQQTLPPAPRRLNAGPLNLLFDYETGSIRRVCYGQREVVRQCYGAVRDRHWGTIYPVLKDVSVRQLPDGGFEITFTATCQKEELHYLWAARIQGDARRVRFEFNGEAQSDFLSNRIGLCLLHPILECAGSPCEIEHFDGTVEPSLFPQLISPAQPFREIRAIRHRVVDGMEIEARFEGEVFETEDQRNWTDASFKTYAPPLERPFPVQVRKGDRAHQSVTLTWMERTQVGGSREAAPDRIVRNIGHRTLRIDWERLRPKPAVGFGLPREQIHSEAAIKRMRALYPAHLRVDCHLEDADWSERLQAGETPALALGATLHIAVFLAADGDSELWALRDACRRVKAPIGLWLIFHRLEKSTSRRWVQLAREILREVAPGAGFAAGTNENFAELNRERPPMTSDWLPCFSLNPQGHAADSMTLIENLSAQGETIRTARTFSTQPVVVSPVTLLPRSNPGSIGASGTVTQPPADPRQGSLFAAAWTLGSISALLSSDGLHSVTYFETIGARGVIPAGQDDRVFPSYHVFAGLAEIDWLAEMEQAHSSKTEIAALAGVDKHGNRLVWLANLTPEQIEFSVECKGMERGALVRRIDERNVIESSRDPEKWWQQGSDEILDQAAHKIAIPQYGLVRLAAWSPKKVP